MIRSYDCKLVLEDGSEYRGYRFGARVDRLCEVVFNTSMVGYQEIVSDLSYTNQAVVMTYPIIGNYGITDEDYETKIPTIGGLVVREYNDIPSNFRYTKTLSEILEDYGIPGMEGVDTRQLTRSIRSHGIRKGLICGIDTPEEEVRARLQQELERDLVARVSCRKRWYARTSSHKYTVVVVDCGVRLSIVRALNQRLCNVTVVPCTTSAETILAMEPDGVVISNGPGDPVDAPAVAELIKELRGKRPLFGIGLGCELMALACGGATKRMAMGHWGSNHPIRCLATGKLEFAGQNHSYTVDEDSLAGTGLTVTHRNVLDNTVEGIACPGQRLFGVLYYPETAQQCSGYLFDQFIAMMEEGKRHA